METRLAGLPGTVEDGRYSAVEQEHLSSCDSCRGLARDAHALRGRITVAGRIADPGTTYWAGILPRVRARATPRSISDWLADTVGSARFVIQGAGLALFVLFLLVVNVTDPPAPGAIISMESLSESDLQELRYSEKYTGLLDHPTQTGGRSYTSVADFLIELLAEDGGLDLYASVDPTAMLREVDEDQFGEIVDILKTN